MESMFEGCKSLRTIDISNFDIKSSTTFKNMFLDCENLEYINFISYNDLNDSDSLLDILKNTPENIVICINLNNSDNKNFVLLFIVEKIGNPKKNIF